jgi:DUF1680 family protein
MKTSRKDFLKQLSAGTAGLGFSSILPAAEQEKDSAKHRVQFSNGNRNTHYVTNRTPLSAQPYTELPIGAIKPKGWMLDQLQRQRDGLTGNLDEVYPKVVGQTNGWLGGDGDGWERGPYWLDGMVPLAYLLGDDQLKEKAQPWIEWSLENQQEDGYFGPIPFEEEPEPVNGVQKTPRRDWWPKMVMLKVLKQYYMATEDERVLKLMTNYFKYQLKELPDKPLGNWSFWGNRRGGDNLQMVYWLYNHTGHEFLLELGELIHSQTFDWTSVAGNGEMGKQNPLPQLHCVNVAQGIKEPVIYFQQDQSEKYIEAVKQGLDDLKNVHGFVNGMYGADEQLHGNNPTQGSELCSAVELMYSLESMIQVTGDVEFADHLEKIAFNVLPAQVNDDYTLKQYFQQANQVEVTDETRNFFDDYNARLCFGVLTGYPCCTTNMHQGWPKLVQNLWYATAENGLAAMVYSSSEVTAKVGDKGTEVSITEETDYPFGETIRFNLALAETVRFPLELRIPAWCKSASVMVNGKPVKEKEVEGKQMVKIARQWSHGDTIELQLPMDIRTSRWAEESVGVERGPLVFGLKIEEEWKEVQPDPENWAIIHPYYEVFPKGPWNYGLTEETVNDLKFSVETNKTDAIYPWNLENVPIQLKAMGKRIPEWKLYNHSAGPTPVSGQHLWGMVQEKEEVEPEEVTLVPYGATTLRISQFPVVS